MFVLDKYAFVELSPDTYVVLSMTIYKAQGDAAPAMNIAAVERDCGLSKDTLRAWERRYGFPAPFRDDHDERLYPADQVGKLRLLRRLIDAGYRPGKIVTRSVEELTALVRPVAGRSDAADSPDVRDILDLLRAHRTERLREALAGKVLQHGLGAFAMEVAPDLAEAVGAAWSRGDLEIHQEHLFTEQLTAVLRSAINGVLNGRLSSDPPRVLLTTFPQEPHALGILMGIELILNSANVNYVAFARYGGATYDGQIFAIFVIMLAAAEAAIGLAIVLGVYQSFETIDVEATDRLRG